MIKVISLSLFVFTVVGDSKQQVKNEVIMIGILLCKFPATVGNFG